MTKLKEQTYGTYIFMELELNGKVYQVSEYLRDNGSTYKTSADNDPATREAVIRAYNELY